MVNHSKNVNSAFPMPFLYVWYTNNCLWSALWFVISQWYVILFLCISWWTARIKDGDKNSAIIIVGITNLCQGDNVELDLLSSEFVFSTLWSYLIFMVLKWVWNEKFAEICRPKIFWSVTLSTLKRLEFRPCSKLKYITTLCILIWPCAKFCVILSALVTCHCVACRHDKVCILVPKRSSAAYSMIHSNAWDRARP